LSDPAPSSSPSAASKLPAITLAFWVMKICATTLGETAGDLLSMTMHLGYAESSVILISFFAITLAAQLASRTPRVWLYWTVILSTSTAGTTMSDYLDRSLHLGYALGSALLVSILLAVLAAWRFTTGSLSVSDIHDRRSEAFYWVTILFSNTLGTALGDFLADDSGLGFAGGAALLAAVIAIITALAFFTKLSRVGLFWAAFVLTRPLGATLGDLMTKPRDHGGLDLGTGPASLVLVTVLVALVVTQTLRDRRAATTAAG
jgi:uncharacterized membrane-anchored protein